MLYTTQGYFYAVEISEIDWWWVLSEFCKFKVGDVIMESTPFCWCKSYFDALYLCFDGRDQLSVNCDWNFFVECFQFLLGMYVCERVFSVDPLVWKICFLVDPIYDVQHDEGHVVVVALHLTPNFGRSMEGHLVGWMGDEVVTGQFLGLIRRACPEDFLDVNHVGMFLSEKLSSDEKGELGLDAGVWVDPVFVKTTGEQRHEVECPVFFENAHLEDERAARLEEVERVPGHRHAVEHVPVLVVGPALDDGAVWRDAVVVRDAAVVEDGARFAEPVAVFAQLLVQVFGHGGPRGLFRSLVVVDADVARARRVGVAAGEPVLEYGFEDEGAWILDAERIPHDRPLALLAAPGGGHGGDDFGALRGEQTLARCVPVTPQEHENFDARGAKAAEYRL